MPLLKTVTLGCKVNQYETQYLREGFLRLGYREADPGEPVDLCIVNTCTVTAESDLKSRKAIRQLARRNPHAEIIVIGCYAARAEKDVSNLPGVTEVVADKQQLPDLLARRGLVDVPDGISHFGPRRRAYVKVQDGCRMQCSYCIIPTVRPRLVSRPARQVLEEVRRLVDYGHREIVLTGIHLGHYGVDLAENTEGGRRTDLADLLDRIVRIEGDFRVRLSSLEALEVTPKLIRLMAERSDRICPHLHLAMQSGSDAVLARMNRRQGSRPFVERCRAIAESLPQPALTADVIVGFPGETDADFQATCRVVESVGFSKTHVFRFSPRQGTPAAEMADQVPAAVKHDRAAELAELGRALRERFLRHLVGRNLQVLIESSMSDHPGRMVGTSARYAPVELAGSERDIGRLVEATAVRVVNGRVVAENASEA